MSKVKEQVTKVDEAIVRSASVCFFAYSQRAYLTITVSAQLSTTPRPIRSAPAAQIRSFRSNSVFGSRPPPHHDKRLGLLQHLLCRPRTSPSSFFIRLVEPVCLASARSEPEQRRRKASTRDRLFFLFGGRQAQRLAQEGFQCVSRSSCLGGKIVELTQVGARASLQDPRPPPSPILLAPRLAQIALARGDLARRRSRVGRRSRAQSAERAEPRARGRLGRRARVPEEPVR